MRAFKDKNGNQWKLDVTVGSLLDVKDTLGVDLIESPQDMPSDMSGIISLLYIHLEEQIKERELNEKGFTNLLTGSVLKQAIQAFTDELVDFFLEINPLLGNLLVKQMQMFREEQAELVEKIKQAPLDTFSEWPEPSGSTQDPGSIG